MSQLTKTTIDTQSLHDKVCECIHDYLSLTQDCAINNLYQLSMNQVESALFSTVLQHCNGNQTKAAAILGINRGTFRKKCQALNLL